MQRLSYRKVMSPLYTHEAKEGKNINCDDAPKLQVVLYFDSKISHANQLTRMETTYVSNACIQ